jgi:hypothetical protein
MAIFAKKTDGDHKAEPKVTDSSPTLVALTSTPRNTGYGIAEAIQLMRGLPVDQNPDLVVRVVRATLASLNVHLADIIEDATKKQKTTQERIAGEHAKVADLEKQLAERRKEIAALEADLKETTTVKERLQLAEKAVPPPAPLRGVPAPGSGPHTVTPPLGNKTPEETASKD